MKDRSIKGDTNTLYLQVPTAYESTVPKTKVQRKSESVEVSYFENASFSK